ncbi:hypothetical protein thalar_00592 [Litoreibacter arenae DSM 19593]|uniref:Uncharacterized protein n=1 Tax=Litoreibacter arenae DSM 19593 TaxID=1123360 RepID=S9QNI2_9RHOB|nr:hypothetical protein thalar_00592 [Litoreibacter arenae DSM 19593]
MLGVDLSSSGEAIFCGCFTRNTARFFKLSSISSFPGRIGTSQG